MASAAELAILLTAKDSTAPAFGSVQNRLGGLSSALGAPVRAIGGLVSSLGSIGLAGLGISTIKDSIMGLASDAIEAQKVMAATNAVIASTKGVAGVSASAVTDLANALSMQTAFGDEAIQSAENMLLTFTRVGSEVFPDATQAILDLSQATGQDLQSSAVQLGKALNDPIKGITALTRVGVSFTQAQKDQIKAMVEAGDVAGAQKVILAELATEFGGAAKAAGETFAGRLAQAETAIGNVKEAIGNALLPILTSLLQRITPVAIAFAQTLPAAIEKVTSVISSTLGPAIQVVQDFLKYLSPDNDFDLMRAWFGGDIGPLIDDVVRSIKDLASYVGSIGEVIGKVASGGMDFGKALEAIGANAQLALRPLGDLLGNLGGIAAELGSNVLELVSGAWETLKDKWPAIWAGAGDIVNGLVTSGTELGGKVLAWVQGVWATLSDKWPGIWESAGDIASGLLSGTLELGGKVLDWVTGAWATLAEKWPAIWQGAGDIIGGLVSDVTVLGGKVLAWVQGAWATLSEKWPDIWAGAGNIVMGLLASVEDFGGKVVTWITEAWAFLKDKWPGIWQQAGDIVAGLLASVEDFGGKVVTWVTDTWATLKEKWPAIWAGAGDIADGLIQTLNDSGFPDKINTFIADSIKPESWLPQMQKSIDALPAAMNWESFGRQAADAMILAIVGALTGGTDASDQVGESTAQVFIQGLLGLPMRVINTISTVVAQMIVGFVSELWGHLPELQTALGGVIVNALSTLGPKISAAFKDVSETITAWLNTTAANLLAGAAKFGTNLVSGLTTGVATLPTELASIWTTVSTWLTNTALAIFKGAIELGKNLVEGLVNGTITIGAELATFLGKITKWITTTAGTIVEDAKAIGTGIIDGIVAGLSGGLESVKAKAREIAEGALNSAKEFLGIKSPSEEFRQVGAWSIEGFLLGMLDRAPDVFQTAGDIGTRTTNALMDGIDIRALQDTGQNARNELLRGIDVSKLTETAQDIGDQTTNALMVGIDVSRLRPTGEALVNGLMAGIVDGGRGVLDAVTTLAQGAVTTATSAFAFPAWLQIGTGVGGALRDGVAAALGSILDITKAFASQAQIGGEDVKNALLVGIDVDGLTETVQDTGQRTTNALMDGLDVSRLRPTGEAMSNALLYGIDVSRLTETVQDAGVQTTNALMQGIDVSKLRDTGQNARDALLAGINIANLRPTDNPLMKGIDIGNLVPTPGAAGTTDLFGVGKYLDDTGTQELVDQAGKAGQSVLDGFKGWLDGNLMQFSDAAGRIGTAIIDGIVAQITAGIGTIASALIAATRDAVAQATDTFTSSSATPSSSSSTSSSSSANSFGASAYNYAPAGSESKSTMSREDLVSAFREATAGIQPQYLTVHTQAPSVNIPAEFVHMRALAEAGI